MTFGRVLRIEGGVINGRVIEGRVVKALAFGEGAVRGFVLWHSHARPDYGWEIAAGVVRKVKRVRAKRMSGLMV
jgi:hypothetical protein